MAAEKDSTYWMESELERKRLASNHYIAKDAAGGKLVLAPVDFSQPVRILDSGTADGTYSLRFPQHDNYRARILDFHAQKDSQALGF